ncbi:MAG: hypothetical protein K6F70_04640 [Eggerthellaceae bacterium]|nr:hypothetical protein [Eggerthellaceae bacterium]
MSDMAVSKQSLETGFDPFACEADVFEDDGGDQVPQRHDYNPNPISVPRDDTRPASVRIAELLDRLGSQRATCLGILGACAEPAPYERVREVVEEAQRGNASVFDAGRLCSLLQRAGALERVDERGFPYDPDETLEEVSDGDARYLRASAEQDAYWLATPDGLAAIPSENYSAELEKLLEADAVYLPIYRSVLRMASREEGVKAPTLMAALDRDPLLQRPKRSCTLFVQRLHDVNALEWRGAWFATELGAKALRDIDDACQAEPMTEGAR